MRYLGNKESIVYNIIELLKQKNLMKERYVFFDAFCGTGTVSNAVKSYFDIIINDNLALATTFASGRIIAQNCKFNDLGFDPIVYLNSNDNVIEGFFYKNYAPTVSNRMYFNDYNAKRIDYFRSQIEEWKSNFLINDDEYCYLLGCLLESVSKVSNVAGVYGAYLKTWDPRAEKEIKFIPMETTISNNEPNIIKKYNCNLIDIIEKIDCDILYLDPPYTKNKYSTQYHLLETLVRNDNPELRGITGCRDLANVSDNWSKPYSVEIEFATVIKQTKAKHIVLSYSSDGIMSKEYISNVLKRYGKENTFTLIEIPYKKYRNSRTNSNDEHYEYIFYIEKKNDNDVVYCCPLNYMGGKSNVIAEIKPELNGKNTIIDLMGGGFNVGINSYGFDTYIYNDTNFILKDLIRMFKESDTVSLLKSIDKIIKDFGLEKHNRDTYLAYRKAYNDKFRHKNNWQIYLYVLVLYGFQQQLRFNSKYEFNNPVGESGYNESVKEKIVSFSLRLKEIEVALLSYDYEEILPYIDNNVLLYVDPPYLITLGSYNDGKRGFNGWNENEEVRLINFLEKVKETGCKILISNILEYKTKKNILLIDWINKNNANVKEIVVRGRKEVLISYEAEICNR